jgi:hypothetical protein
LTFASLWPRARDANVKSKTPLKRDEIWLNRHRALAL